MEFIETKVFTKQITDSLVPMAIEPFKMSWSFVRKLGMRSLGLKVFGKFDGQLKDEVGGVAFGSSTTS